MIMTRYLKIHDWKTRFLKDRISLMKDIVKSFLINIPFQNITSFGSVKPEMRILPNFQLLLSAVLKGSGGLCGHHNYFMKLFLESLGYETHNVSGTFRRTGIPSSHCMCLVKINPPYSGHKGNSQFLIDVGCGVPLEEPLDLAQLPFHGRAGGLDYVYERIDDHSIQRVNKEGDVLMGKRGPSFLSPQDYVIDLGVKRMEEFKDPFSAVYKWDSGVYLHQSPYIFRYLSISDQDYETVFIRGTDLILATRETRTVESFKSLADLKPVITKYFPMINSIEVDLAIENFSQPLPTKVPKDAAKGIN